MFLTSAGDGRKHPECTETARTCAMFKAAWATVDAFAAKKGLTSGMTAILHTWGSNLFYHPHIHCIVPGGGIDSDGVWHEIHGCRGTPFLFPVTAMSRKFRGRFMNLLTRRQKEKGITIPQGIRKKCFDKDWVIHTKPPVKGVGEVLEYIGRYAYRVAITRSNLFAWLVQEFQNTRCCRRTYLV